MSSERAADGIGPTWQPMETGVKNGTVIGDPRLESVYRYWCKNQHDGGMPLEADIHLTDIAPAIASHAMILEVVRADSLVRFRYLHVGKVFWRASGVEPTGHFLDECLPAKAGYRDYVIGVYQQVIETKRPLYTENLFTHHGHSAPMGAKRVSLPISKNGAEVDMILAAHLFDFRLCLAIPRYGDPLAAADGLQEAVRVYLSEQPTKA